jgi:hypothetical protein
LFAAINGTPLRRDFLTIATNGNGGASHGLLVAIVGIIGEWAVALHSRESPSRAVQLSAPADLLEVNGEGFS